MAHEALRIEDRIGGVLPCNVVVQARPDGHVEVAAIDPVASMESVGNPALSQKAAEVAARLGAALERI